MKNLCSIDDVTDDEIRHILQRAAHYAPDVTVHKHVLPTTLVVSAFFEPSTRTRLSFEAAAANLGAAVIGFSDSHATSVSKGETLGDTARVLDGYGDLIVVRHPERGSAERVAEAADVPVVNAGDGDGQHPTQALTDLFTMQGALGALEGRRLAILGDLRFGRTTHSLVPAVRRFGMDVVQCPAPGTEWPGADVPKVDFETALAADVVYQTRIQKERFPDAAAYQAAAGKLRISRSVLEDAGSDAIIMHPLPRVDELDRDVDDLPAAKYFLQAKNGVPVRMAVLEMLLGDA